jgi:hypothetical protein
MYLIHIEIFYVKWSKDIGVSFRSSEDQELHAWERQQHFSVFYLTLRLLENLLFLKKKESFIVNNLNTHEKKSEPLKERVSSHLLLEKSVLEPGFRGENCPYTQTWRVWNSVILDENLITLEILCGESHCFGENLDVFERTFLREKT